MQDPREAQGAAVSRFFACVAASLLLAAGCAASSEVAPGSEHPAAPAELSAQEVQALIGEVAALRGVALQRPIPVERLDRERFAAAVDAYFVGDGRPDGERIEAALHVAAQRLRRKAQRAWMQGQVVGSYHEERR